MCAAESCDEVVFEGTDGPFGGVATVDVGWHKLEIDFFLGEVLFQEGRGFIVKEMEFWAESGVDELLVKFEDGIFDVDIFASLDGLGEDGVTVVVVEHDDVFVALGALYGEASGLIGVGFALV